MSKIEQINKEKPLSFSGYRNKGNKSKKMIQFATDLNCPQLRFISVPVKNAVIKLSAEDSAKLLGYLKGCCWREDFDKNLQGLANDDDGEHLLTGWMSIDEFNSFTENAGHNDPESETVIRKLHEASIEWKAMGIDDVYFDGYVSVD